MSIVTAYFTVLPVLFILYAGVRYQKRRRAGLIFKDRRVATGEVTAVEWKQLVKTPGNQVKERYVTIKYKVRNVNWTFKAAASRIMTGEFVQVVYEQMKPSTVLLESEYRRGWRGWKLEVGFAVFGAVVILLTALMLILTYSHL